MRIKYYSNIKYEKHNILNKTRIPIGEDLNKSVPSIFPFIHDCVAIIPGGTSTGSRTASAAWGGVAGRCIPTPTKGSMEMG